MLLAAFIATTPSQIRSIRLYKVSIIDVLNQMQLFASIKNNIAEMLSPNETVPNMEETFKVTCSETEFSKEAMINPPETTMF